MRKNKSERKYKSEAEVIVPVVAFVIWAAAFSFVMVHFR
jgi:hypothetical protein